MLQPTIYIPSRLTRILAISHSAQDPERYVEPCRLIPIGVTPTSGRLCALVPA
jgi:hypothetical protein